MKSNLKQSLLEDPRGSNDEHRKLDGGRSQSSKISLQTSEAELQALQMRSRIKAAPPIAEPEQIDEKRIGFVFSPNATEKEMIEEGYRWDYVLVLPNPEDEGYKNAIRDLTKKARANGKDLNLNKTFTVQEIVGLLHTSFLQTYMYKSVDGGEIYVKIRTTIPRLQAWAAQINYAMQLDEDAVKDAYINGIRKPPEEGGGTYVKPIADIENANPINDSKDLSPLSPYKYIYAQYNLKPHTQRLWLMDPSRPSCNHSFTDLHRLKLIKSIINR